MTQALEVGASAADATEWRPSHPGMRAAYQQFMQDFDRREALRTSALGFVRMWSPDASGATAEAHIDVILSCVYETA